MPVCRKCREEKPLAQFAKNTSRGKTRVNLCRLCVAEQAKFSLRTYKQLPKLKKDAAKWHTAKLNSEMLWLSTQLYELAAIALKRAGSQNADPS